MSDSQRESVKDKFEEDEVAPYKQALGRPSKYDPKYCEEIIEFMALGYSATAFAGAIGVSRSTLYKWADENEDFSDALKVAQARAAVWWESVARNIAQTNDGNATAAIFGLKNRVADEWRDRKEVAAEHSGPNGGPIATADVTPDRLAKALADLPQEQRDALRPLLEKFEG